MRSIWYPAREDSGNRNRRFPIARTVGFFHLAWLLAATGCATTQLDGKKLKASNEGLLSAPANEQLEKEEAQSKKQESLAAVEEFLSRTQEYRFPAKTDPSINQAPAALGPIAASPRQPAIAAQTTSPPALDATYANAQISISEPSTPVTPQAVPAIESVSIRNSQARVDSTLASEKPKMTNGPLDLSSRERNEAMELLISSLKEDLKTRQDPSTEWKLRMLLLALDRDAEEASLMDSTATKLKGLLPAWSATSIAIRNLLRNPDQGVESAMERAQSLTGLLAALSGPRVKCVALCRKVATFGSFEEMSADEFISGRTIQTIVYAEIESLRATQESNGVYQTKLATRLEVLTIDGKSMWQREEPEVIDRCRRPRRDFFVAQRITLPPSLPVGDYVLKFTVEDKASGMMAESSVPFGIQSPISVAKWQP